MRTAFLLILFILFFSSPVFAQQLTLPQAAHAVNQTAGSYVDPVTGNTVYRLSDRTLCPEGAKHFYSYTNHFSISGDITFMCHKVVGSTQFIYPVIYDASKKLISTNARADSNFPGGADAFADLKWSQVRRVLYGIHNGRLYELDPFNHVTIDHGPQPCGIGNGGLLIGPNDEILTHCGNGGANIYLRPTPTSAYLTQSTATGGHTSSQFDEANTDQVGRPFAVYASSYALGWNPDFTGLIVFDDGHGHMGFFRGSNGKSYVVRVKNDLLPNGNYGQIGCPNIAWRPEFALYNSVTGQRELIWGCDQPAGDAQWDRDHFARTTRALDVFGSSGHVSIALWTVNWTTGTVGRLEVARVHAGSCGYWGTPRGALHPDATEMLFDSAMADGQVLESDGSAKNCARGDKDIDAYVATTGYTGGGSTPGPDTIPPFMSNGLPSGTIASGITQTTISVTTNEAATCRYSTAPGIAYSTMTNAMTASGFVHSAQVSGLQNGQTYNYYVRCKDTAGNENQNDLAITFTVSLPPPPAAILLNTSLGSSTEVSTPNVGTGTGSSVTGATFAAGQVGNGVLIDAANEYVRYQQTAGGMQNVELDKGTIEFWYRPSYAHNDGQSHYIFATGQWGTPGAVSLIKRGGSNNELSAFIFPAGSGIRETNIPSSSYSWAANQWVKLRVTWDASASQILNVYVDGVQKTGTGNNAGPITAPAESTTNYIYIGVRNPTETIGAGGVIDELVIASVPLAPGQPWPGQQQSPQTCSDGTPYGQCSSVNVGQMCNSGTLIDSCSTCSCAGQQCNTFTQQCQSSISYSKLTFRGKLIKNTLSQQPCVACLITIGLQGTQNTTTTATDGTFTLELYRTTTPGNYIFDITVVDGATTYSFKRRGIIS